MTQDFAGEAAADGGRWLVTRRREADVLALILMLVFATRAITLSLPPVVKNDLATGVGLTDPQYGLLTTVFMAFYGVSGISSGIAAARWGGRLLIVCCGCFFLGSLIFGLSSGMGGFLVGRGASRPRRWHGRRHVQPRAGSRSTAQVAQQGVGNTGRRMGDRGSHRVAGHAKNQGRRRLSSRLSRHRGYSLRGRGRRLVAEGGADEALAPRGGHHGSWSGDGRGFGDHQPEGAPAELRQRGRAGHRRRRPAMDPGLPPEDPSAPASPSRSTFWPVWAWRRSSAIRSEPSRRRGGGSSG